MIIFVGGIASVDHRPGDLLPAFTLFLLRAINFDYVHVSGHALGAETMEYEIGN